MYGLSWFNYFYFLILPLVWNILFTSRLPMHYFPGQAPAWLLVAENIARACAFGLPVFMPVSVQTTHFREGLALYAVGLVLYFGSWVLLMVLPSSTLDNLTLLHFLPAVTPILWLWGIALMSGSWLYAGISLVLVVLHVLEYVWRIE